MKTDTKPPVRKSKSLLRRLLEPHSRDEDTRRRESIFNVLIAGTLVMVLIAFLSIIINIISEGSRYHGMPAWTVLVPVAILLLLYRAGRHHFHDTAPYLFVLFFLSLGTYALYVYGYELPEGLLTYAVVIVMAGILLSPRGAFTIMALIIACLGALAFVQERGITRPDLTHQFDPLNLSDVMVYVFLLAVILLVSWLSNRDLENSLQRAHRSEAALRKERNSLETKVRERTRELEQAQVEKMLELHRFAEFGRFTATLLHELANPLTSVALELEELEKTEHSEFVRKARLGIDRMEQYVDAARRQLATQSELKTFDSAAEIIRVTEFLSSKAANQGVRLQVKPVEGIDLYGDSMRFNQILSNLIANAIDACESVKPASRRRVVVSSALKGKFLEVSVQDWGVGLSRGEKEKIFEPFYTTKSIERGTGIGLSITKRTVETDFGGSIIVESTKHSGACFKVLLPLYEN